MNCQYCNKTYSNKQNLVKHQKTESCINKQNLRLQLDKAQSENKELKDEIIRLNTRLEVYSQNECEIKTVRENYESKINSLTDEIKTLTTDNIKLQTRLEIYSEQKQENCPSINITNNNNISTNTKIINQLQVLDLNKNNISKIANRHFTLDYLKKENKGVAQFTINHVIKDSDGKPNYICTDISRKIAKYKSVDNSIVTDFGMEKLSSTIYDSIKNKVNSLVMTNMAEEWWGQEGQEEKEENEQNPYYINQLNLNKNSPEFYNHIAKAVYSKNIV